MMNQTMNAAMSTFLATMNSCYEANEAEITRLKVKLEEAYGTIEILRTENERLKMKKRTDYGVRSFEDHNGKRWYLLSDLVVSAGFSGNLDSSAAIRNRIKYGSVRKFTYREMVGKVECPPCAGVKCVDEKGREEFLGKPLISTGKGHSLNTMKVAKIRELRSAGVDFRQIAKEVGCSVSTACKYAIA